MSNIINAIINICTHSSHETSISKGARNRANMMGDALEDYIKNAFAGTFNVPESEQMIIHEKIFSFLGSQNRPPDAMLRNGAAIEVKKLQGKGSQKITSQLALNSSYPKTILESTSPMISDECRYAEKWTTKDMIYAIGVVKDKSISSLCFVYGVDYAANAEIYEKMKTDIKYGIETMPDLEFTETKELGRVNKVDPLGITSLRIRGMWQIKNPFEVFSYVYEPIAEADFNMMAIINLDMYDSFDNKHMLEQLADKTTNLSIKDIFIKNPNNPAQLKNAKLITYYK